MFQAIAFNNGFINDALNNKIVMYTDNVPWNESATPDKTFEGLLSPAKLVFQALIVI